MKKGGAAKGELVLALYELANCFRNGWGIKKDPVAAKQYYETAANLGDTDAMNEVAWCYVEGFGCKKDKVSKSFIFERTTCVGKPKEASSTHAGLLYHALVQVLPSLLMIELPVSIHILSSQRVALSF
jgi:hypothetical protein